MAKRKSTELSKGDNYKITVKPPEEIRAKANKKLRCIYESTLIVGSDRTITGKRYQFEPGEVQPVDPVDYDLLLSLEQNAGGCCGGGPAESRKYFEEVN